MWNTRTRVKSEPGRLVRLFDPFHGAYRKVGLVVRGVREQLKRRFSPVALVAQLPLDLGDLQWLPGSNREPRDLGAVRDSATMDCPSRSRSRSCCSCRLSMWSRSCSPASSVLRRSCGSPCLVLCSPAAGHALVLNVQLLASLASGPVARSRAFPSRFLGQKTGAVFHPIFTRRC